MKVWILKDGEVTPAEKGDHKKQRTWRLAEALVKRGHEVTWWASNFNHFKKTRQFYGHKDIIVAPKFKLKLLEAGTYTKNISFRRIQHHHKLGKVFAKLALKESPPDIIIASMPILEFPTKAIQYAQKLNIPVIIDVRDKWPDSFSDYFPKYLKPFIQIALYPYQKKLINCFQKANRITSMSEDLLNWAIKKARLHKNETQKVFYLGYDEFCGQETVELPELKSIPTNKFLFGYLGTFVKSYEIELILKAAKILENDDSFHGHFIIAGDGEKRSLLEKMVAESKNVTLLSWLNKLESAAFMKFINVGIIPNLQTAIPNKVFESLFYSNPVIFCMNGEARTFLEKYKAGIYYQQGNVNSLVSAIKALARDEVLQEMKKNAQVLYSKRLRSDKIYTSFCEFIEKTALL